MIPRMRWLDAVRARNYHRDLYSIYKAWTENEMTIEALLKDILDTNKKIAEHLERSGVKVVSCPPGYSVTVSGEKLCEDEGCPHHGTPHVCVEHKAVPEGQYLDPDAIGVMPWADDLAAGISRLDLDGKDMIVARVVYWTLKRFYRPSTKPDAQLIAQLQVAIAEIMRGKHVVFEELAKPDVAAGAWNRKIAAARDVVIDGVAHKSNGSFHPAHPIKELPPITREQVERAILRATDSRRDIIPTYAFADAVDNLMELLRDGR